MRDMDIEHPDITAMERDGRVHTPYKVEIEVTTAVQRAYINDNNDNFIDWCFADPDIIRRYLEETGRALNTWIEEVLGG